MHLIFFFFSFNYYTPFSHAAAYVSLVVDSDTSIEESDTQFEACAELVAGVLAVDVSVNISIHFLTASCPTPLYTTNTLTFYARSVVGSRVCQNVTIFEDDLVEDNEVFAISLERASDLPPLVIIHPISMVNITIVNDDCKFMNIHKL